MTGLTGFPDTPLPKPFARDDVSFFPGNDIVFLMNGRIHTIPTDAVHHTPEEQLNARLFLFSLLDTEQRREYSLYNRVTILSEHGKTYRLLGRVSYGIHLLDRKGFVREQYCVIPKGASSMPLETLLASQILHLRFNESGFIAKANHNPNYDGALSPFARVWRWLCTAGDRR